MLLPVPGHTPGSMALLVRRPGMAPLLMVGDLTYGAELLEAGRIDAAHPVRCDVFESKAAQAAAAVLTNAERWPIHIADVIVAAQKNHPRPKLISQNIANHQARVVNPPPAGNAKGSDHVAPLRGPTTGVCSWITSSRM